MPPVSQLEDTGVVLIHRIRATGNNQSQTGLQTVIRIGMSQRMDAVHSGPAVVLIERIINHNHAALGQQIIQHLAGRLRHPGGAQFSRQTLFQILPQILRKSAFIAHHPEAFRMPTECRSQQPRQYRFATTGILGDHQPLVRQQKMLAQQCINTRWQRFPLLLSPAVLADCLLNPHRNPRLNKHVQMMPLTLQRFSRPRSRPVAQHRLRVHRHLLINLKPPGQITVQLAECTGNLWHTCPRRRTAAETVRVCFVFTVQRHSR